MVSTMTRPSALLRMMTSTPVTGSLAALAPAMGRKGSTADARSVPSNRTLFDLPVPRPCRRQHRMMTANAINLHVNFIPD
jgi:hypothetical protein